MDMRSLGCYHRLVPNRIAEHRAVARVRHGSAFTQAALAVRLGVARSTVARWERGSLEPTVSQAQAIARELGVTLDDLFGDRQDTPMT